MAIQNNINGAIGTIGSAIAVAQHLSEQEKANEKMEDSNKINLMSQALQNKDKQQELAKELDQSLEAQNELKADVNSIDESVTGMYSKVGDKRLRTSKGQFYSEKAFQNLEDARTSKESGIKRLNGVIKNVQDKQHLNAMIGIKIDDMLEQTKGGND